jgi:hypothetical protein
MTLKDILIPISTLIIEMIYDRLVIFLGSLGILQ